MEFFQEQKQEVELRLLALSKLFLPKIFLNGSHYVIAILICIIFAFIIWLISRSMSWEGPDFGLILGGGLFVLIIVLVLSGRFLRKKALSEIMHNFQIISDAIAAANTVLDRHLQDSLEQTERDILQAKEQHQKEKGAATEKYARP
jgi:hypothetical protein